MQNLDHLVIVAGIIDDIGIVEIISTRIGENSREKVSAGVIVKAKILVKRAEFAGYVQNLCRQSGIIKRLQAVFKVIPFPCTCDLKQICNRENQLGLALPIAPEKL